MLPPSDQMLIGSASRSDTANPAVAPRLSDGMKCARASLVIELGHCPGQQRLDKLQKRVLRYFGLDVPRCPGPKLFHRKAQIFSRATIHHSKAKIIGCKRINFTGSFLDNAAKAFAGYPCNVLHLTDF